jgi:hypothetical protein
MDIAVAIKSLSSSRIKSILETRTRISNKNAKRETRTRTRNSNKNAKQEQEQETIKLSHLCQSVDGSSLFSKQEQEQDGELGSEQRQHEKRSMELLQIV